MEDFNTEQKVVPPLGAKYLFVVIFLFIICVMVFYLVTVGPVATLVFLFLGYVWLLLILRLLAGTCDLLTIPLKYTSSTDAAARLLTAGTVVLVISVIILLVNGAKPILRDINLLPPAYSDLLK